ncbi:DUF3108 domain-containing protein [Massilia sp. DWR3-1-1]|uniref:DUF3108 domain-containing protein n=1 Tax=Massilia sp. DWR3-1-1 TaxID=2804559 RepID=UPI003CE7685D
MTHLPAWRRVLARERPLLLLGAASVTLHLLVLGVLGRAKPRPPPSLPTLTVQLKPGAAAQAPAPAVVAAAARPPAQARSAMQRSPQAPPDTPAPAALATPAGPSGLARWDIGAGDGAASLPRVGGRPAVETPPPAYLSYAVTIASGGAVRSGGAAALEWRTFEHGYQLLLSGDNGVMGVLDSRGSFTDSGFAPLEVRGADGADAVSFDWSAARASFARSGSTVAVSGDIQDRAAMLMRLAGVGLADPAQLAGGADLLVAGADGAARVRFENMGEETLQTALGPVLTVHLRQRPATAAHAAGRLDVWLAPALSWYPVQLQLSGADGSVLTQTITAFNRAPP